MATPPRLPAAAADPASSGDDRPPPSEKRLVNSSAYGFCVFEGAQLPQVRQELLDKAAQATTVATPSSTDEQLRGTILLSEEGVNVRLSGTRNAVDAMQRALRGLHKDLTTMEFKDSYSERLTLPRMLVKIKKEVISMGDPGVQPATDGLAAHISPEEFKRWLDEDRDVVILDTRNDYEVRLGTFEKAVDLDIQSFRAFPSTVRARLEHVPKDKPVIMFCTGGVRCEKAAYTLIQDGRSAVYQLDGGILKYFARVGGAHYRGDCYIFDDRVALTPALEEGDAVACFACRSPLTREDQQSPASPSSSPPRSPPPVGTTYSHALHGPSRVAVEASDAKGRLYHQHPSPPPPPAALRAGSSDADLLRRRERRTSSSSSATAAPTFRRRSDSFSKLKDRALATTNTMDRSGVHVSSPNNATTSNTTPKAEGQDDQRYFAQRQSTMDSATLDKLLMAEKHLFHAGQATLQAWKLIGRDPDAEAGASAHPNAQAAASLNAAVQSAAAQQQQRYAERESDLTLSHLATPNAQTVVSGRAPPPQPPAPGQYQGGQQQQQQHQHERSFESSAGSSNLSSSPKLAMEIPRSANNNDSGGRNSFGQYSTASSSAAAGGHSQFNYSTRSTVTTLTSDAFSESNVFAENGRSKSSHANIFGLNARGDAVAAPRSDITLFHFTVRKSDSVLEKLGSKKATIQLQVDIEARMLSFISPHENRESYSCAAVTARPQSRLGMQLKIQTGTTSLTKKINFLSTEERANFIDALEQGKVMSKKGIPPFRGTESSMLSDDATVASLESSRAKPRESIMADNFTPLPGEAVLEHVQRVTNLVVMSQSDRAVQGVLKITTFRITFSPYDSSWKFGSFEVPLSALDVITRDGLMLLIACKDLRTIRLAMHDAYTKKKGYDQLPSTPDFRWLNALIQRMRPPNMMGAVFAFDYYAEKKARMMAKPGNREDGWLLYSPVAEYQRLGFLRGADSYNRKHGVDPNVITWRLLKNSKFRFSPTYPQLMVVPSLMTEEQLVQSARFRSRARLPVVVWRHPVNKCVLARSSQPNYGMAGNRSEPDRILLKAYRDSAKKNSSGEAPPLHIIDARKPIATKGNRLKGKGVENSQHYDNATIEFMGIANIHKMRESLDALKTLVSPNAVDDGDKHYHNRLENTRWLKHVMRVLSGARRVAEVLHEDGASVLVHCSDGWDRTPQLVGLAQLILDPYYRTIRGFAVLIEKEWCSFGHKFADRVGVGKDSTDQPNERSPVMLQFLDCVWQMTRQFPTAFEFNEKLLLHVSDALISGLFGSFLYNTERERIFEKVWERTESVWTPVLENSAPFKNPMYRATNRVIYPRANLKRVVLWDAMFFRWDPESHPDYMEYMNPVDPEDGGRDDDLAYDLNDPHRADYDDVEKAMRLEIDEIHDFDEMRIRGTALSDCSDMSDDEDMELRMSLSADHSPMINEEEYGNDDFDESQRLDTVYDFDDDQLERYRKGAEERTRQRAQGRNIREAIMMAPDQSRIKYLEQLLSESVARELQLEAELDSVQHQMAWKRSPAASAGAASAGRKNSNTGSEANV